MRSLLKATVLTLVLCMLVATQAQAEGEITIRNWDWVQEGSKVTVRGTMANVTNRDITGVQLRFTGYGKDKTVPLAEFRYDHQGLLSPAREAMFQFSFDCKTHIETSDLAVTGAHYR